jgi:hypothetical protein
MKASGGRARAVAVDCADHPRHARRATRMRGAPRGLAERRKPRRPKGRFPPSGLKSDAPELRRTHANALARPVIPPDSPTHAATGPAESVSSS